MAKPDDEKRPIIIIKKVKKIEAGHHGGAWKVAYADFVTAMMAFFLLLWLLNVTTDEQKELISAYFAPADPRIAESTSGAGGVMGGTTVSPDGAMTSDRTPVATSEADPSQGTGREDGEDSDKKAAADAALDAEDNKAFQSTAEKIKEAIEQVPELQALKDNLLIDMTPEGLRIQIVDQDGKPMFESGSAKPLPPAERLLRLISSIVEDLPNKISIRGHTDSVSYGADRNYGNWELSADRANASRRVMLQGDISGHIDASRVENVQGKADREPLDVADPKAAKNRRISIILLKQSLTGAQKKKTVKTPAGSNKPELRKPEEGVLQFP